MLWSPYTKGECQRCGFKANLRDLVKEWTGLMVHEACRDPKPEELRPVRLSRGEGAPKPNASPETTIEYALVPPWGLTLPPLPIGYAFVLSGGLYVMSDGQFVIEQVTT